MDQTWRLHVGDGQLIATAIHDGHELRPDVAAIMALSEEERLREEDPYTGVWAAVAPTRCISLLSRFEVDLNRPRDKAVYLTPADAWGLNVWKHEPPAELIAESLKEYDTFYSGIRGVLQTVERMFGSFVVLDLHTYNHRRGGPDGPVADETRNPQVNIGTGTMARSRWASIVDRFMSDLRAYDFPGGALDVRENVKFRGGQFSRWVHQTFPKTGCAIAIEFKKFFMDEWTGEADQALVRAIGEALRSTVPGVLEELNGL